MALRRLCRPVRVGIMMYGCKQWVHRVARTEVHAERMRHEKQRGVEITRDGRVQTPITLTQTRTDLGYTTPTLGLTLVGATCSPECCLSLDIGGIIRILVCRNYTTHRALSHAWSPDVVVVLHVLARDHAKNGGVDFTGP